MDDITIKLTREQSEILYEFLNNTNDSYLDNILREDFDREYISELDKVFESIYNQMGIKD